MDEKGQDIFNETHINFLNNKLMFLFGGIIPEYRINSIDICVQLNTN